MPFLILSLGGIMRKIVEYKLANMSVGEDFETKINRWIEKGWQPLGGIFHTSNGFYQVMVKYEEKPPEIGTVVTRFIAA